MESGCVHFLTFSTHGTHLLGDERGSNHWSSKYVAPNRPLFFYMKRNLKEPPVEFACRERALVHDAMIARAIRAGWTVDALNVRKRHVHIVVFTTNGESKGEIVRKLKEAGTRALYDAGFRKRGTDVWTKMSVGSVVWNIKFWRQVVEYVLRKQGDNIYLRQTEFGKNWIVNMRKTSPGQPHTIYDLYGGAARAEIRREFFLRRAEEESRRS